MILALLCGSCSDECHVGEPQDEEDFHRLYGAELVQFSLGL